MMDAKKTALFANDIRRNIVYAINSKGGGHIGGCLSISDLIAVLYEDIMRYDASNPDWKGRDFLICSKGHAAPAIYVALALKGFFPKEWLADLNKGGTHLPGHSDRNKVPGVDATTGSLGQGMSIACGLAHAIMVAGEKQYVYCITGDGETDEGQIWEAAMYAAHHKLSQLIMFLDWNKKQIDGTNDQVMQHFDLEKKYSAFGWYTQVIDGNNIEEIYAAINDAKANAEGKPSAIIMDTVKGAGVPCIETLESNHCIGISDELAEKCFIEIKAARTAIEGGAL